METSALNSGSVTLTSMFLLGLLSTGHCVGMCGPLVLALPAARNARNTWKNLLIHLAYHLGRVTTYTIVGALVGALSALLQQTAQANGEDPLGVVERLQLILSIITALVLLGLGLTRLGVIREPQFLSLATPSRLPGFAFVHKQASAHGRLIAVFALGLLLGLLPCGLSYAAFTRSLTATGLMDGALIVAAFGFGTIPGLLLLGTGVAVILRRHRRLMDRLAGVLLVLMALSIGADAASSLWFNS